MDVKLEHIKQAILETCNPVQIILFGSRARGDYRPDSDYDVLVVFDDLPVENKSIRNHPVTKIYRSLYKNDVGVSVDVLVTTNDRYTKLVNETGLVYQYIKEEGKIIYGTV